MASLALDHLNQTSTWSGLHCLLGANGGEDDDDQPLLLNFILPTTGTCYVNGIDVTKDPLEPGRAAVSVSENVMLYGNFTARQNLDFLRQNRRQDEPDQNRLLPGHAFGLAQEKAFEQRVKNFSKGCGRSFLGISIAIKDAPGNPLTSRPRA